MGGIYRNAHELICVFRAGDEPPLNNVELGRYGRNRTNVWSYAGLSSFGKDRDASLGMHPTVKPTALVIDAIKDCSRRGEIVLDAFSGSGTTIIAAHKWRRARASSIRSMSTSPFAVGRPYREAATMAITSGTFAEVETGVIRTVVEASSWQISHKRLPDQIDTEI
jgi:hypothetical protein